MVKTDKPITKYTAFDAEGNILEFAASTIVRKFGKGGHVCLPKELVDKHVEIHFKND